MTKSVSLFLIPITKDKIVWQQWEKTLFCASLVVEAHFLIWRGGGMGEVVNLGEDFRIVSCEQITDIESRKGYKKLGLTSSQKIQMGGLLQQFPAVFAAGALSDAYILKLPEGISGVPMQYKAGGIGTSLQGADGKIGGHGSLHELSAQTAVLGVFNIMSIASGQYFLAEINSEMKSINKKMDQILAFLYGDKKAELMAEISFAKYAYQNYSSIMEHEQQRLATIINLQNARKVAMKDIEFYMLDLDAVTNCKNNSDIEEIVNNAVKIKECLILSMQLYSMSSLLEVYYAQNYEAAYISDLERDVTEYVSKCESRILSGFSMLKTLVFTHKEGVLKKVNKPALFERIEPVIHLFGEGGESNMQKSLRTALHASEAEAEYYVSLDGDCYLKTI